MSAILGRLTVALSLIFTVLASNTLAATEMQDSRDNQIYELFPSGRLNWFSTNLAYKGGATISKGAHGFYAHKDWGGACPSGMHIPTGEEWDSLLVQEFKGPEKVEKMKKFVGVPRGYYRLEKPHDQMGAGSAFFAIADGPRAMLFDMDNHIMRFIKLSENSAVSVRCVRSKDIMEDLASYGIAKDLKSFTDSRDGLTYKIEIRDSTKIWMTQNLKYNMVSEKQCYMEDTTFCKRHGRFYTYKEALNACPRGWHLPDDGEWRDYQKDRSKLNWDNLGRGGCRDWDEYCDESGTGHYWSKTSVLKGTGRGWEFRSKGRSINRTDENVEKGMYVRCVINM